MLFLMILLMSSPAWAAVKLDLSINQKATPAAAASQVALNQLANQLAQNSSLLTSSSASMNKSQVAAFRKIPVFQFLTQDQIRLMMGMIFTNAEKIEIVKRGTQKKCCDAQGQCSPCKESENADSENAFNSTSSANPSSIGIKEEGNKENGSDFPKKEY